LHEREARQAGIINQAQFSVLVASAVFPTFLA
jgi:hypothetical protein